MKTFKHILAERIRSAAIPPRRLQPGECQTLSGRRCGLCYAVTLDYESEVAAKQEALQEFWRSLRLPCTLDPLIASPLGRHYRTTTKRRAFFSRGSVRLGLITPDEEGKLQPFPVERCAIEPVRHCEIYTFIQENVAKPYARKLARHLNYVVIKGNYDEQTIIFNINDLSPDVVRAANTLSKSLTRSFSTIIGVFLYEDVSRSRYYLRSHGRRGRLPFRKVFGKAEVFHRVAGRSFLFSPLSFSQINHSILEQTIHAARTLLMPSKEQRFFDLYCGYGLFALCCAAECKAVVGAEASAASIASAVANARRQKAANVRFMLTDINKETIERILHTAQFDDLVLLDPPRSGTADGVIEQIAATRPARVLHIFCEIELIPKELKRWEQSGYRPTRAVPLDMFPGTSDVEIMVALKPMADTPRIR